MLLNKTPWHPQFLFFFVDWRTAISMLRHLVFADCAALSTDPKLRDIFLGMAYGIYPFCVSENRAEMTLVFRRLPTDRSGDKPKRLAMAVEALARFPGIQAFQQQDEAVDIHVEPNLSVAWPDRRSSVVEGVASDASRCHARGISV